MAVWCCYNFVLIPNCLAVLCRVLTFPPGGHCVSLPQSGIPRPGSHRLVLASASAGCSGRYICQVTESRPPFHTEQAAARLAILGTESAAPLVITCFVQSGRAGRRGWRGCRPSTRPAPWSTSPACPARLVRHQASAGRWGAARCEGGERAARGYSTPPSPSPSPRSSSD